jgi:hypothetical protein
MAEEFFGSAAFSKTEVDVKQPPPVSGPMSLRKQIAKARKEHKQAKREGRARIKALNGQIRAAKFGRGLARVDLREKKAELKKVRRDIRRRTKAANIKARGQKQVFKAQMKLIRHQSTTYKAQFRQKKKALKSKRRAQDPRFRARLHKRAERNNGKAFNLAWAMRLIKKAFAKRKGDARNHGFSGSGKGGRTGRAGYHAKSARRIRGGV